MKYDQPHPRPKGLVREEDVGGRNVMGWTKTGSLDVEGLDGS